MISPHNRNICPASPRSESADSCSEAMATDPRRPRSTPISLDKRRSSRDPYAISVATVSIREAESFNENENENEICNKGDIDEANNDAEAVEATSDNERQQCRRKLWKTAAARRPQSGAGDVMGDSFTGPGAISSFRASSGPTEVVSASPSDDVNAQGPPRMRGRCRNGTPSDIFGWMGSFSSVDGAPLSARSVAAEKDENIDVRNARPCTARMRGRTRHGTPSDLFGWEGSFSSVVSSSTKSTDPAEETSPEGRLAA